MNIRSNTVSPSPVKPGDMVQVFHKLDNQKRGKWLSPRNVLSVDPKSGSVTAPGCNGRTITAALEDARFSLPENDFAKHVQDAINELL